MTKTYTFSVEVTTDGEHCNWGIYCINGRDCPLHTREISSSDRRDHHCILSLLPLKIEAETGMPFISSACRARVQQVKDAEKKVEVHTDEDSLEYNILRYNAVLITPTVLPPLVEEHPTGYPKELPVDVNQEMLKRNMAVSDEQLLYTQEDPHIDKGDYRE